jgi:hypothetical protein
MHQIISKLREKHNTSQVYFDQPHPVYRGYIGVHVSSGCLPSLLTIMTPSKGIPRIRQPKIS